VLLFGGLILIAAQVTRRWVGGSGMWAWIGNRLIG
jgi:hypothetical protein